MSFKKMLGVTAIIIFSMFGLMLATSYAWYSYENGSTTFDGVTEAEDLLISYQNGDYINTSIAVPIKTTDADRLAEKNNFNIRVTGNDKNEEVKVGIKLTDVSIDSALGTNSNFKIQLYYQGSLITHVMGGSITSGNDIVFDSVMLDNDISNQFEIRVYLFDDDTNQNNLMNKIFSAKIEVEVLSRLKPSMNDYNNADIYISSIKIDGESSNSLPTEGYYSMTSSCTKGSTLSWEPLSKTIIYNKGSYVNDTCSLTFTKATSTVKLSDMPVGSYVKYIGKGGVVGGNAVTCQTNGPASSSTVTEETEAPNSCLGQNAREDIDTNGNTYGYCYNTSYKYYTTGWRIAYIDDNNKPVIISAGSPECASRPSSTANKTYINLANTKAMKYCNSDYVDGDCSCLDSNSDGYCDCTDSDSDGLCDEIENGTVDAWAVSDIDFYNMTKAISGVGKRLMSGSSSLGDSGGTLGAILSCYNNFSYEECGYNNDLIDNGGYYWFASRYSSSSTYGMDWSPDAHYVNYSTLTGAYGLRPVISLQSSVYVTGGSGTMDDPYTIDN